MNTTQHTITISTEALDYMRSLVEVDAGEHCSEDVSAELARAFTYATLPADARAFLEQNTDFARDLTADDMSAVRDHAQHYAGGLVVIFRKVSDGVYAKAHDSWGGGTEAGEPGNVVVHVYDDNEDRDDVTYFMSGHEALAAFLAAE